MSVDRREFIHRIAAAVGATATAVITGPVFDPRSVDAVVESEVPGQGAAFMTLWRNRQFEYTWLGRSKCSSLRLPDLLGKPHEAAT